MVLAVLMWVAAPWKSEPSGRTPQSADQRRISEAYGRIPLHFEANHGQTDDRVKFVTRGRGYTMFLTANEAVLALSHAEKREPKDRRSPLRHVEPTGKVDRHVLRMTLAGANPNPRVVGQEELPGKSNYFIGNDPSKWRTNVPTYARVHYQDIYPGIDLVYYGNQRALEYDFVVRPGADPAHIALGFEGADRIEIDAQGDLVLHTAQGAIRQRKPFIYQEVNGVRREVSGSYVLMNNQAGFQVSVYDSGQPLVIDPTLFYSTFLGGTASDFGHDIAVDSAGSAYVTGSTDSVDFPTMAAFQPTRNGAGDAFVTKLDATGGALAYSTYFGGSGSDTGLGVAVDATGNLYVTGATTSADFPTLNAVQPAHAGGSADAFVAQLNTTGSALVYSTYLGGTGQEGASGVAVDFAGNTWVTGGTASTDFPTTIGAFQPALSGSQDAFVAKLSVTGSALIYSTYLGGTLSDFASGIAVDPSGSASILGTTPSTDFPTTEGAFQTIYGGGVSDAFVTRLGPTGSVLYSTYLGGTEGDEGIAGLAVDAAGNAYVTGSTSSVDFPTVNPFQAALNGDTGAPDAFVTKLNAAGSALIYSTYLGGTDSDSGADVAVDGAGTAHVTGLTESADFPIVAGAIQSVFGGDQDVFLTKLDSMGSVLIYSTYLGGSSHEQGASIELDDFLNPNAYVAGSTFSTDFPTTDGAFDTTYNGDVSFSDVFVAQVIDLVLPPQPTTARVRGQGVVPVLGGTGKFHLIVRRQTDGTLNGRVQYRNRVTDAQMKSETITSLVITANAARIDGTCGTLCTFTVEVTDVDDGPNDTFTISINGGPPEGGTLQKGNIRIEQ